MQLFLDLSILLLDELPKMLLFLAHVSPSFLRELPPVEISKDHPSEKSKVWLEPESATTTSVWWRLEAGRGLGSFVVGRGTAPEHRAQRLGPRGSWGWTSYKWGIPCYWLRGIAVFLWLVVILKQRQTLGKLSVTNPILIIQRQLLQAMFHFLNCH